VTAVQRFVERGHQPPRQLVGRLVEPQSLERELPLGLELGDVETGSGKRRAVVVGDDAPVHEPRAPLGAERVERGDDRSELVLVPEQHGEVWTRATVEGRGQGAA
jgi:hypothetical protein